jgi:hypothetical protein
MVEEGVMRLILLVHVCLTVALLEDRLRSTLRPHFYFPFSRRGRRLDGLV